MIKQHLLILPLVCSINYCEAGESDSLYDEILTMDTKLFHAFNQCDLKTTGELFSQDLEFYHDLGGLSNYQQTMKVSKENCDRKLGLRRTLTKEGMAVYPIGSYGAIHKGRHTFCHIENGVNDCGTFEFVHVWERQGEGWKVKRVISYGH